MNIAKYIYILRVKAAYFISEKYLLSVNVKF